ncbi:MAG: hypothetical protein N3H84_06525, partial [Candidatus Caldarchaeum sp.]|nr:hypothetical protein [Candidatus Caldarchaeum sp.]
MSMNCFLLGVGYDGHERKAYLKLLDTEKKTVKVLLDDSGHKPYCLAELPKQELEKNPALSEAGAIGFVEVEKYDSINDSVKKMTLIQATDPLAVGGGKKSIREIIPSWEADIPYHLNYVYDQRLIPSMMYELRDGLMSPVYGDEDKIDEILNKFFASFSSEERDEIRKWLKILESPHPPIDFTGLDIEILGDSPTRVPSPSNPVDRVVAVSFSGTKNMSKVLVLKRDGVDAGFSGGEYAIEVFDDESALLSRCFDILES